MATTRAVPTARAGSRAEALPRISVTERSTRPLRVNFTLPVAFAEPILTVAVTVGRAPRATRAGAASVVRVAVLRTVTARFGDVDCA